MYFMLQSMVQYWLLFLVVVTWVGMTTAGPEDDLITDLPGLTTPVTFKQYSGYLKAGDGRMLHYW